MNRIFKITMFVYANMDQGESDFRFPRLRLVLLLREFFQHGTLKETLDMIDENWPAHVRDKLALHDDGYTQGIRVSFITDESGVGRLALAVNKRRMSQTCSGLDEYVEFEDIEELSTSATVVFGG